MATTSIGDREMAGFTIREFAPNIIEDIGCLKKKNNDYYPTIFRGLIIQCVENQNNCLLIFDCHDFLYPRDEESGGMLIYLLFVRPEIDTCMNEIQNHNLSGDRH
jgi:hypothetical protein